MRLQQNENSRAVDRSCAASLANTLLQGALFMSKRRQSALGLIALSKDMDDDLIPLKRVAARLGVSRATLWRVSRSTHFPAPEKVLGRIYWRACDLAEMEAALDAFQGRSAFERERRRAKACQAATKAMAAQIRKPKRVRAHVDALTQPVLFGGPLASAPHGAARIK